MISHRTYFDRLCHGGKSAGFVLASFILILASLFLATGVAFAQKTYTVTSLRDDADANRGDGNCQTILLECTLRAAVEESNLQPGIDTILFSSTAPISFTIAISSPFVITDGVTIRGPLAPSLIIDSQRVSRHFTISNPPGAVTLENMTFVRGALCCAGVSRSPSSVDRGSAIYAAGVPINLVNIHFVDNENSISHGGALSLVGSNTTIVNSSFVNNRSDSSGGAIYLELSQLAMSNSIVTDNRSTGGGGGLFLQSSNATITNSTFARNLSNEDGGAIYLDDSQLILINSTFSENQATNTGGALYHAANTGQITYTVSIYNSTIVNNSAGATGGGIYQAGITPRSLPAVAPSETQLHNSILAGNFLLGTDTVDDCFVHSPVGIVTSLGYNLLTANSAGNCQLSATGDQKDCFGAVVFANA